MRRFSITLFSSALCLLLLTTRASAQQVVEEVQDVAQQKAVQKIVIKNDTVKTSEGTKQSTKKTKKKKTETLMDRLVNLDALVSRTTGQKVKQDRKTEKTLHIFPETSYLGQIYSNSKYHRYLVVDLKFLNTTAKKITIKAEDFQLKADDKILKLTDIPSTLSRHSFSIGRQSRSFKSFKIKEPIEIAAGGEAKKSLIFTPIPGKGVIPDFTLAVKFKNQTGKSQQQELDLNLIEKARLKMTMQKIGPKECLGYIEIAGELNTVNFGSFVKTIDTLNGKGIGRFVVCWAKDAPAMSTYVNSWLQQQINNMNSGNVNYSNTQFPPLPGALHEFHLATLPKNNNQNYYSSRNRKKHVHKTRYSALLAALRTAYEAIPAESVVDEVRNGHPLCRAIALDVAGFKLENSQLPYILELSNDKKQSDLQFAAIKTLGHFNDESANKRMLEAVTLKDKKLGSIAVISLLSSRFADARASLQQFFNTATEDQKAFVMEILIKHPRPAWSDTIYASMTKTENAITLEGLRALNAMGHPKLLMLLERALRSKNSKIKSEAVKQLISRKDLASRQLAIEYVLENLKKDKVDSQAINLVKKTQDPRAVPLLLEQLKKSKSNRSTIIAALGSLGDQTVGKELAKIYPKLNSSEKSSALTVLRQLQSEHFLKFAEEALNTKKSSSIVRTAAQGLAELGTEEAERIMIDVLKSTKNSYAISNLCRYLGQLGTENAKKALIEARSSDDKNKRTYAISALRNMRNRSPANQLKYYANQFLKEKKWKQAEKAYTIAIKIDNSNSEFYVGRGKVYLALNKPKQAHNDFRRAFELDPYDHEAVGYVAILDVKAGNVEKGITFLRDHEKKFEKNNLFYFLSARVYALALANIQAKPKSADIEKQIEEFRKKAIEFLQKAVKKGFRDYAKMKKEADFKSLKDDPEFKAIYNGKKTKKKKGNARPALAIPAVKIEVKMNAGG